MKQTFSINRLSAAILLWLLLLMSPFVPVVAQAPPPENPQAGSVGMEGSVSGPPPSTGATIATPTAGSVFTSIPITVSGLCPSNLLVKVFVNNVFVGSQQCTGGSYALRVDLFSGQNDIVARVYDALDQAGPDSNMVTVTFRDAQFAQFGTHVTLTSNYARKGADPGVVLSWPIIISGGTGPYAISVDWGDKKPLSLQSASFAGTITIHHVYDTAGIYNVIIKATDANNTSAYLQLVGVANGQVGAGSAAKTDGLNAAGTVVKRTVLWQPLLAIIPLLIAAFWLGRRHELFTIRRSLEESRRQS